MDDLSRRALALLRANRRAGRSARLGRDYAYTSPSPGMYAPQFFWDSCFHAIALAGLEPEWAKRELRTLVSVQRPDGFLPHVIFWTWDWWPPLYWAYTQSAPALRPRMTGMIQPPVLAYAAQRVVEHTGDRAFGAQMLPALRRYHDWLRRERDPDDDGLLSVVSPFETGMDWLPPFDLALGLPPEANDARRWLAYRSLDVRHMLARYRSGAMLARFDVEDVAFNSIWHEAQLSLATLARALGDGGAARRETDGASRTRDAIVARCWDDEAGAFFSLAGRDERKLRARTIAGLLPLLLAGLDARYVDAIVRQIDDPHAFGTPFPLPSVAVGEPSFRRGESSFIWRGPAWLNTNWFVARGLMKHGRERQARRIARSTVALVERSGFREYYDPFDGRGMGARGFGWSTLAVDLLPWAVDGRDDR